MLISFNERLKYVIEVIMIRTKKTKKTIAEDLNISPSALTQLTNGKIKTASPETLAQLKKFFLININWLENGNAESIIEMFTDDDGFSNLREEVKVITTSFGEKVFVGTNNGWAKVLDYYYNSRDSSKTLNQALLKKINSWQGISGSIRSLKSSPVFLDNYSAKDSPGTIYNHILFYLEGSKPKGYIIAEKVNSLPCNHQDQSEYENRIILKCLSICNLSWKPIKLNNTTYEYFIDLSHTEYLNIINKPLPRNHIDNLRG